MYNYSKLKPALLKFRHETALEYGKKRITYSELSGRITALSNALLRMSGKTVAILLRNSPELVLSAFSASAAGKSHIIADSKTVSEKALKLVKKYKPEIVIMPKSECARLEDILIQNGCKTVIFSDGVPQNGFPAAFALERLVIENDYSVSGTIKTRVKSRFFDDYENVVTPDITAIGLRDRLFTDTLMYTSAGARMVSEILYTGHRLCFEKEISPTYFRKQKIQYVITDRPELYRGFKCEVLTVETVGRAPLIRIGQALFYPDDISAEFTKKLNMDTKVSLVGEKIQITVKVDANTDVSKLSGMVCALRRELLYPFDMQIGLKAVKST